MMKQGSILFIVCALFALFSHTYGDEIKFCPKNMVFDGSCPNGTSGRSCFEEIQSELGQVAMPHDCSCQDLSAQKKRKCTSFSAGIDVAISHLSPIIKGDDYGE
ncbi:hypothetical protein VNO77_21468 [Canavalia gladiata]|uniref:Uncharacterized protein n=1 Tax=Canavalia gladiata TaxID=3824 RepID=A0AAN9LRH8_CANGL